MESKRLLQRPPQQHCNLNKTRMYNLLNTEIGSELPFVLGRTHSSSEPVSVFSKKGLATNSRLCRLELSLTPKLPVGCSPTRSRFSRWRQCCDAVAQADLAKCNGYALSALSIILSKVSLSLPAAPRLRKQAASMFLIACIRCYASEASAKDCKTCRFVTATLSRGVCPPASYNLVVRATSSRTLSQIRPDCRTSSPSTFSIVLSKHAMHVHSILLKASARRMHTTAKILIES